MKSLLQILKETNELNTSCLDIGTDKNTRHCFVEFFYEKEFKKYQEKSISLLEIGVYSGASLYLWGKYFESGKILGLDIVDRVRNNWKSLSNTSYLIKNAYKQSTVDSLQNFDIIIDDGPHTLDSQISCIKLYLPKLNDGGVLIIEDVSNVKNFEYLKENTPSKLHDKIEMIDLRHVKNKFNDLLFVIRK